MLINHWASRMLVVTSSCSFFTREAISVPLNYPASVTTSFNEELTLHCHATVRTLHTVTVLLLVLDSGDREAVPCVTCTLINTKSGGVQNLSNVSFSPPLYSVFLPSK